ncbi:MAG: recombinase [Subdoligranulum sp.]|nr:recombinase [Subdoligranulum sp.]
MVGHGSVNHNSRKFHAKNTDPERSHLNKVYCNENIRDVYRELFDAALKRYNEKQTRTDRQIKDYYEKIRSGKQEKTFHEVILQVGNWKDMHAESEHGQLAAAVLDEYMQSFGQRNPQLRVFSAHLHMDEATPHLHIDFVPFITGSKRGLDTRVSLKQALAAQGFKGGSRGDTEWNQWVQSEKQQLATVMARHGIEWEDKDTHETHLSVQDFKKQERAKEVAALEAELVSKKAEYENVAVRIKHFDEGLAALDRLETELDTAEAYQLPDPPPLMTAKAYKAKVAAPLVKQLKSMLKTMLARCCTAMDHYTKLSLENGRLYREKEQMAAFNARLMEENKMLKAQNRELKLLQKFLGKSGLEKLLREAKNARTARKSSRAER